MPKGVLFDLDGTLLDSAPDFIASLDSLLTRHNQPKLNPEIIRSHVSDGSWKLTSLGFNIDISDHKCSVLREELLDMYENNLLKYGSAFDGIKEMLFHIIGLGVLVQLVFVGGFLGIDIVGNLINLVNLIGNAGFAGFISLLVILGLLNK